MAESLLLRQPSVLPPLDPGFRPLALGNRAFAQAVLRTGGGLPVRLALERSGGQVSVFEARVLPSEHSGARDNARYVERLLKFLLWQKGGYRVSVAGPQDLALALDREYAEGGERSFDAAFMARVYEKTRFSVLHVDERSFPSPCERPAVIGGHLDGCRIGFDAGGSDRKVAAVIDGREVFSAETVWHPKLQADPQYHIDGINESIRLAAEHLPRIDAIGVSSAGIYVNNQTRVASLFRRVPHEAFEQRIRNIYLDVARSWGDVPMEVANDGDVAALAGAMELGARSVLGIAMGTSLAAGYVDEEGRITGWLNELAFAPLAYGPDAALDAEWSGDRGVGSQYLSQDAVIRLANRAGLPLKSEDPPAAQLVQVQDRLGQGDPRAHAIFESLGVYLGYGLLHYADFYPLKHVLLLGRVMSGAGGALLFENARRVLRAEDPALESQLRLHLPNESSRRLGQSLAAATLPRTSPPR